MSHTKAAVYAFMLGIVLIGTGCWGTTTASGVYAPTLPSEGMYLDDFARIETVPGKVVIHPIGIRVSPEGKSLYVDFGIVSATDKIDYYKYELFSSDSNTVHSIQADQDRDLRIKHWRQAMHDSWWSLNHFSILSSDGLVAVPRADESLGLIAVQHYAIRGEADADRAIVVLDWERLLREFDCSSPESEQCWIVRGLDEYEVPVRVIAKSAGE